MCVIFLIIRIYKKIYKLKVIRREYWGDFLVKKKVISYVLKGNKRNKEVILPSKFVRLTCGSVPRLYKSKRGNFIYGVKLTYYLNRKKDAKINTKIVSLPRGAKNIRIV